MATRKIHRHGGSGETSSESRLVMLQLEPKKNIKEKTGRFSSPDVEEPTVVAMQGTLRSLFSRKHVSVREGLVATQSHDIGLRPEREASNSFVGK